MWEHHVPPSTKPLLCPIRYLLSAPVPYVCNQLYSGFSVWSIRGVIHRSHRESTEFSKYIMELSSVNVWKWILWVMQPCGCVQLHTGIRNEVSIQVTLLELKPEQQHWEWGILVLSILEFPLESPFEV